MSVIPGECRLIGQQLAHHTAWCPLPLLPYLLSWGNVPGSGHTEPLAPGRFDGGDLDLGPGGESPNQISFLEGWRQSADLTSDRAGHAIPQGLKPSVCQAACWAVCREKDGFCLRSGRERRNLSAAL